jgi:hypothetical protein
MDFVALLDRAPSEGGSMNRTHLLRDIGQSLWLDNITREMLDNGTLGRYVDEFSITGLTSNPTIFDAAISNTGAYDDGIRDKVNAGSSGEALFIELALEDLRRAADLFRPAYDATDGVDGWASMEISPLLVNDTAGSIAAAKRIHDQGGRPNLFVKIPGTPEGVPAIEESIFAAYPSTSRCCSRAISTSPRPTHGCAASNGGSRPGWTRASRRSPRYSSAAGTRRWATRCRPIS